MGWGWFALAAIGVIALIVFGNRKTKPTPVTPTTPVAPALRPAPKFRGFLLTKQWYGFGEQLFLNTREEVHGCDAGSGAPTVKTGIEDNGSGPYLVRLRAYVKDTGAEMPVYTTASDHVAYQECSGKWMPSGAFKVYLLGRCPYTLGVASNCNEFIPLDEYNATKSAKAKKAKACGCGGNGDGGSTVTYPTKPTTVVRIELMVKNADGVIGDTHEFDIIVETRSCS